jgi:hypothetical protein
MAFAREIWAKMPAGALIADPMLHAAILRVIAEKQAGVLIAVP